MFNKGDKPNGFYLVKEGSFECVDDHDVGFQKLQRGDVFGEPGVFPHGFESSNSAIYDARSKRLVC